MIDFRFICLVDIRIAVVLEVTLLSVPEVRADEVWKRPSLYVQNFPHL